MGDMPEAAAYSFLHGASEASPFRALSLLVPPESDV
jgi:hypothetical protein